MCQALNEMMEDSRQDGLRIGEKRGEKIGEKKGEKKLAALIGKLMSDCRTEDLEKAVRSEAFRRKLYREYGMR